ncbi:MAG: ATP-binding protein [Bacteroidaceae bacterium]|nr:ATP-binding protein [Bacteroidaceae bacterium]
MAKIKARESQNIEYKSTWHDEYLKWICGFANAQGAVMYFGVNNDHEVIGLDNVDRLMEDIPNKIVTTMGIVVDVNLCHLEGLDYIEVYIEPSNIPINYRGKYYYRSGSTMQELRGPAFQQFVLKKMVAHGMMLPTNALHLTTLTAMLLTIFSVRVSMHSAFLKTSVKLQPRTCLPIYI